MEDIKLQCLNTYISTTGVTVSVISRNTRKSFSLDDKNDLLFKKRKKTAPIQKKERK